VNANAHLGFTADDIYEKTPHTNTSFINLIRNDVDEREHEIKISLDNGNYQNSTRSLINTKIILELR
jgi:hypothetical protein